LVKINKRTEQHDTLDGHGQDELGKLAKARGAALGEFAEGLVLGRVADEFLRVVEHECLQIVLDGVAHEDAPRNHIRDLFLRLLELDRA